MNIKYSIYCKVQECWQTYDLTDYELTGSGTGCIIFLRCHLCNDYWIGIKNDEVGEGFRYEDQIHTMRDGKPRPETPPQFQLFVATRKGFYEDLDD